MRQAGRSSGGGGIRRAAAAAAAALRSSEADRCAFIGQLYSFDSRPRIRGSSSRFFIQHSDGDHWQRSAPLTVCAVRIPKSSRRRDACAHLTQTPLAAPTRQNKPRPSPPHHRQPPGAARVGTSAALAAALRNPAVNFVALTANFTLDTGRDFTRTAAITVARPVTLALACQLAPAGAAVAIDLGDNAVSRVLVSSGGSLHFSGPGLRLVGVPSVLRHPLWPDYNPLLLGLLDLTGTGTARFTDVTMLSRSPVNVTLILQRYPEVMQPDYSVSPWGAVVRVLGWNLTHAQFLDGQKQKAGAVKIGQHARRLETGNSSSNGSGGSSGGGGGGGGSSSARRLLQHKEPAPAAAAAWPAAFNAARPAAPAGAAAWTFENVALEMPNTLVCFALEGVGGGAPCDSGETLKRLLRDPRVTHIALLGDNIVHEEGQTDRDAAGARLSGIEINRKVAGAGRGGVRRPVMGSSPAAGNRPSRWRVLFLATNVLNTQNTPPPKY
jgi:uncharacterized membrane protein YgcG